MSSEQLPLPTIAAALCNGCGHCIARCPTGALGWDGNKAALIHPEACIWCSQCEQICPTNAIGLPYLIRFGTGPRNDQ